MPNKQQETCAFVLENASSFSGDKSYGVLPTAVWGHVPPYPPTALGPTLIQQIHAGVCELAEALGSDPSVSSNSHSRAVDVTVRGDIQTFTETNQQIAPKNGWLRDEFPFGTNGLFSGATC